MFQVLFQSRVIDEILIVAEGSVELLSFVDEYVVLSAVVELFLDYVGGGYIK